MKNKQVPLHKVVVMIPKMVFMDTNVVDASTIDGLTNKSKKFLQFTLQLTNLIHALFGLPLLLYSAWMFIYGLKNHTQYFFLSWFLWACMGLGTMLCLLGSMGYSGAASRRRSVLAYYLVLLFLQVLTQVLVGSDVYLNDQWQQDFPPDPTQRFDSFVEYVRLHPILFKFLVLLLLVSQVASFFLALLLRAFYSRRMTDEVDDVIATYVPFLNHASSSRGYYMA